MPKKKADDALPGAPAPAAEPGPKKTRAKKESAAEDPPPAEATKRPRAKKPEGEAAAPRKPRAPGKRAAGKRGPPQSWRAWLVWEAATVLTGVALGLGATSFVLWKRAQQDIDQWLAAPPVPTPGVIWSAPLEIRPGWPLTPPELVGDLLAAGYERVEKVEGPGQFSLTGATVDVWTAGRRGLDLDEGKARVVMSGGVVSETVPARGLRLAPTALATIGDLEARRSPVRLDKLSPWVEPAVIAMEDARFREHHGVDPLGVLRALAHNVLGDGGLHGGSTLTQQLAKNLFLTSERSMQRKVREAFFAAGLEHRLGKDALLELYLSEVYLGQSGGLPVHGVEAAARAWFGTSAARLELDQAATIAGVISAPNRYAPHRYPERAVERRDLVLDRMVTVGAIDESAAAKAKSKPLLLHGELPGAVRRAPWAVDMVVESVEEQLGEGALASAGHHVHTTIQPVLQRAAERAIREGLAAISAEHPSARGAQAAAVVLRVSDGAVVAVVGGEDYARSPFNRATHAWRQAGSTVKPLTFLTAFDRNAARTPIDRIVDGPITRRIDGKDWTPANYDQRFKGEMTLREALVQSRNIPAVLLAEEVGWSALQRAYRQAGMSRASHLPSAALGGFEVSPMEMASAYSVFPGGGSRVEPLLVRLVGGAGGDALIAHKPQKHAIASARAAALVTTMLEGVITDGTGKKAIQYGVRGPTGGKTGTTSNYRDAWFVGFTPEYVIAVWVGHDRGTALGLTGGQAALPIWSQLTMALGPAHGAFPIPSDVARSPVCTDSLMPARDACPVTYTELFPKNGVPKDRCDLHGGPVVDIGRGLRRLFGKRNQDHGEPDRPAPEAAAPE